VMAIAIGVAVLSCAAACAASYLPGQTNVTGKADSCGGQDWGTAGVFDFYVFEQSWPAEFCHGKTFPGCKQPTDFMRTRLTIHGLWPNYASSQSGHMWPQCCASKYGPNVDPTIMRALANDLKTFWPNEQDPNPTEYSQSLWQHEWNKHGTCAGIDQQAYFSGVMRAVYPQVATPAVISSHIGGVVTKAALQASYSKVVKFQCTGTYLASVESCFNKNLGWIDCPASGGTDSCKGPNINIASF